MIRIVATVACTLGAFAALGVFMFATHRRFAGAAFPVFFVLIAAAVVLGSGEV